MNYCFYKDHKKLNWLPEIKNFRDAVGLAINDGEGDIIDHDEDGDPLPGNEWRFETPGGRVLLEGRDEIEAETGYLDLDGVIKRLYVVDDLSADEAWAVYKEYCLSHANHKEEASEAMDCLGIKKVGHSAITDIYQDSKYHDWHVEIRFYEDEGMDNYLGEIVYEGDIDRAVEEALKDNCDKITAREQLERWMPLLDNIFD